MSRDAATKAHFDRLVSVGCVLCRHLSLGKTPAEIHHPKEWTGAAQRADEWLGLPLCEFHHRGAGGIHGLGKRGFYARYKLMEHDLLAMALRAAYS